jgi:hypothetical protein
MDDLVEQAKKTLAAKGYIDDFDIERICAEIGSWRDGPSLIRELIHRRLVAAPASGVAARVNSFRTFPSCEPPLDLH